MSFKIAELPDYDQLCYELLHESVDQIIDLGARCNAHSDVLSADERSEDDDQPSPVKVLKAQLGLDGAEDEITHTQNLVQCLTNVLICRHTRRVVFHPQYDSSNDNSPVVSTDKSD